MEGIRQEKSRISALDVLSLSGIQMEILTMVLTVSKKVKAEVRIMNTQHVAEK